MAPIKFTVKTLDGTNHSFQDVDDESTVKELKEKISPKVGIDANLQRLIYCGRVLQDDKKVKDYNVNEKALHLVQRPPPTGGPDRLAQSEARARSRGASPSPRLGRRLQITPIAASANPISVGSVGPPSALVRLDLARSMINRAINVLDDLENVPRDQRQAASSSSSQTSSSGQTQRQPTFSAEISVVTHVGPGGLVTRPGEPPVPGSNWAGMAQALQSAVNSAITGGGAGERSISFQVGPDGVLNEVRPDRGVSDPPEAAAAESSTNATSGASQAEQQSSSSSTGPAASSGTASGQQQPTASGAAAGASSGATGSGGAGSASGSGVEHPPPRVMAEVMSLYRRTQTRMDYHWDRTTRMLEEDPAMETPEATAEAQRLFKKVSEAMHFLSHAQHAMSDIMLDLTTPPPRQLRARPFVIQSALVQSAHAVIHRGPPPGGATVGAAAEQLLRARAASASRASSRQPQAASPAQQSGTSAPSTATVRQAASTAPATPNRAAAQPPLPQVEGMEVSMPMLVGIDVSGPEITIDAGTGRVGGDLLGGLQNAIAQLQQQQQTPRPAPPTSASSTTNQTAGSANQGTASSAGTTPPSRGPSASQPHTPRARVGTQILGGPLPAPPGSAGAMGPPGLARISAALGGGGGPGGPRNSNFDMLLPCNSHHIPCPGAAHRQRDRERERRSMSVPPSRGGSGSAQNRAAEASGRGAARSARVSPTDTPFRQASMDLNSAGPVSPGIEASLRSLLGSLAGGQPGMGAPTTRTGDQASGASDPDMLNVVQRIIGQVFSAMGGRGGNETIASFLESISDYSYVAGQDIVTDLLMCLARSLTFVDLVGFLAGSDAVMTKLQQPLKDFLRARLDIRTSDDIEVSVQRVLDENHSAIVRAVSADQINVQDGVDFAETIDQFLQLQLVTLAQFVWTTPESEFSRGFYDLCQKFLADITNLSVRCFSDGQTSLERLVRNQLSNVSEDVTGHASIGSWTVSTAVGHLRNYVASINDDTTPSYVVRVGPEAEARKADREVRMAERGRGSEGGAGVESKPTSSSVEPEDETFETPRTSPEAMDVSQDGEEEDTGVDDGVKQEGEAMVASSVPEPPPPSENGTEFPRSLLQRSGSGPDMVIGREPWHRSVPEDWVPIITRDQGSHPPQNSSQPLQAPFSDAYLTTVPAKKRRLADARKPVEGSTGDNVQRALADAIKVTGVKPSTSQQAAAHSLARNTNVEKTLEDESRASVKRRLRQDKDLQPEKFPNCKKFMDK